MLRDARPMTAEEFDAWSDQHPGQRFERIEGEIVQKLPTQLHALIVSLLNFFLVTCLRANPIGWALVEARYRLPDDTDNDRIPDLSFVARERGPLVTAGPAPTMPDLAVEVQSPGQSDRQMLDKAQYYLRHGSRMVWLIYPDRRLVEVLTTDERRLLTESSELEGGAVLPGFRVVVAELFGGAG